MEGIKESVEALSQSFSARMATFENELKKISPGGGNTSGSLAQDFQQFQAFTLSALVSIQKQLNLLMAECDALEMRSRRKMLLIHGVPEVKNEDAMRAVINAALKHPGMPVLEPNDIRRAHRMGRGSTERPRPLVVKFSSQDLRDKVWFAKTRLKGSGVTLSEFLTRRRHNLFMEARQKLGVARCWTHQGRVVVLGDGGKRHIIHSSTDLLEYAKTSAEFGKVRPDTISGTSSMPATTESAATRKKRVQSTKK